jgi:chloramphenicol-sensitive protein RarD
MNKGVWYAIVAYTIWGLFPIYWKLLQAVPALQLIGHRIGWSFLLLLIFIVLTRQWRAFRAVAFERRTLGIYAVAGVLVSLNWLVYVWAVNAGFVVEASLGYFINPLLSVLLGVLFLRERLRALQWLPVALATAGVVIVSFAYGSFPLIAVTLALTFGLYGLVKKQAPLGSLYGLTLETGILFIPALLYLLFVDSLGQGAFLHTDLSSNLLMMGAGVVTTIPLLLFSSAARRIPLALIGILQYITPTLQFLLGVLVYREAFTPAQFVGFGLVWVALIVFSAEGFLARRAQPILSPAD